MAALYLAVGALTRGKVQIYKQDEMDAVLATKRDCEIELTLEKLYARRTTPQNAYLWSVVIPRVAEHLALPRRVTHEVLKAQFMDPRLVTTGKLRGYISSNGLVLGTSTRQLNTLEFVDYCDRICEHAAAHWGGLYIAPPDPLWRQRALEELAKMHIQPGEIPFDEVA